MVLKKINKILILFIKLVTRKGIRILFYFISSFIYGLNFATSSSYKERCTKVDQRKSFRLNYCLKLFFVSVFFVYTCSKLNLLLTPFCIWIFELYSLHYVILFKKMIVSLFSLPRIAGRIIKEPETGECKQRLRLLGS